MIFTGVCVNPDEKDILEAIIPPLVKTTSNNYWRHFSSYKKFSFIIKCWVLNVVFKI
jgi:hypothetical protein